MMEKINVCAALYSDAIENGIKAREEMYFAKMFFEGESQKMYNMRMKNAKHYSAKCKDCKTRLANLLNGRKNISDNLVDGYIDAAYNPGDDHAKKMVTRFLPK